MKREPTGKSKKKKTLLDVYTQVYMFPEAPSVFKSKERRGYIDLEFVVSALLTRQNRKKHTQTRLE